VTPTLCAVCVRYFPVEYVSRGAVTGPTRIPSAVALMRLVAQWEVLHAGIPALKVADGYGVTGRVPGAPVEMFACTVVDGTLLCSQHATEKLEGR
jgi:hypothetical protein